MTEPWGAVNFTALPMIWSTHLRRSTGSAATVGASSSARSNPTLWRTAVPARSETAARTAPRTWHGSVATAIVPACTAVMCRTSSTRCAPRRGWRLTASTSSISKVASTGAAPVCPSDRSAGSAGRAGSERGCTGGGTAADVPRGASVRTCSPSSTTSSIAHHRASAPVSPVRRAVTRTRTSRRFAPRRSPSQWRDPPPTSPPLISVWSARRCRSAPEPTRTSRARRPTSSSSSLPRRARTRPEAARTRSSRLTSMTDSGLSATSCAWMSKIPWSRPHNGSLDAWVLSRVLVRTSPGPACAVPIGSGAEP